MPRPNAYLNLLFGMLYSQIPDGIRITVLRMHFKMATPTPYLEQQTPPDERLHDPDVVVLVCGLAVFLSPWVPVITDRR